MIYLSVATALLLVVALVCWAWSSPPAKSAMPAADPSKPAERPVPSLTEADEDEVEITLVRAVPVELTPRAPEPAPSASPPATDVSAEDAATDEEPGPPRTSTTTTFYPEDEPDAAVDEPTQPATRFLIAACGQTDQGRTRRRNEDSYLMADEKGIFAVADGMGGYAGGKVASELAVATLREVFETGTLPEPLDTTVPRRGAEIAWGVQKANAVIFERASSDPELSQMGTTIVAARFSPNKQRAYIAHVGDSRAYRLRAGALRRLTTDHTMKQLGFKGKGAAHLYRAVGIAATVDVDLIIDKPRPDDIYLFCSDGLTKMASDEDISAILEQNADDAEAAAYSLIEIANDRGGKDNITCVVVKVVERIPELSPPDPHHLELG